MDIGALFNGVAQLFIHREPDARIRLFSTDGKLLGYPERADGGLAIGTVVPAGLKEKKHVGNVKYDNITFVCTSSMEPFVVNCFKSLRVLAGATERKSGSIVYLSRDGEFHRKLAFSEAMISAVKFPALDAASKDAAKIMISLAPTRTIHTQASGSLSAEVTKATSAYSEPPTAALWSSSNFKVEIAGLDNACSYIQRVEPLCVSKIIMDRDSGRMLEVPRLDCSDLIVTLPIRHAKEFMEWYTVIITATTTTTTS